MLRENLVADNNYLEQQYLVRQEKGARMARFNNLSSNLCIAEDLQDLYDQEGYSEWETIRKSKALKKERRVAEANAKEVRALAEAQVVEEEQETASPTPLTFIEEVVVMFDNMGVATQVIELCQICHQALVVDGEVLCKDCLDEYNAMIEEAMQDRLRCIREEHYNGYDDPDAWVVPSPVVCPECGKMHHQSPSLCWDCDVCPF